jgi:uncharacterized membrane protein YbaN (DUF454 family)
MNVRKVFYLVLGFIGLGLGALGAMIPLLPSVPFLLLAAVCFGKSSENLHRWFISTMLYKKNLESYVRGEGMTKKAKLRVVGIVTFVMAFGFIMMSRVPVGRIVLAVVWAAHLLYFAFGVKTIKEGEASGKAADKSATKDTEQACQNDASS